MSIKDDWAIQHGLSMSDFNLIRMIGQGSQTTTYLAEDKKGNNRSLTYINTQKIFERYKMLMQNSGKTADESSEEAKRYAKFCIQQQADLIDRVKDLTSDHVAEMIGLGYDEQKDLYFINSEYVPGVDLYYATRGLLPLQMLSLFAQALDGLDFIHKNGFLHLNIKPSRIRVNLEDSPPTLKITDYGFAIPRNDYKGPYGGTPLYMAPEVVFEERDKIDARADLFSFAAVAYYCITRKYPFDKRKEVKNSRDKLKDIVRSEREPAPPSQYNKEVPTELDALFLDLLKHDPDARQHKTAFMVLEYMKEKWPEESLKMPHERTTTLF